MVRLLRLVGLMDALQQPRRQSTVLCVSSPRKENVLFLERCRVRRRERERKDVRMHSIRTVFNEVVKLSQKSFFLASLSLSLSRTLHHYLPPFLSLSLHFFRYFSQIASGRKMQCQMKAKEIFESERERDKVRDLKMLEKG